MNLTQQYPRSPKDKLLGLVSFKRVIDKAKAHNDGTLGDYHYDCPHDKPFFEFLGIDAKTFAHKVGELKTDDAIAAWIQKEYLSKKTPDQIERFNAERLQWHPDPGSDSENYFKDLRNQVAPNRPEIVTWFDLLDLDEKRPVEQPTRLTAGRT